MRFDDRFLDEIRARLSVSHVVGRRVPLKKAGREYRGLSPFKTEKTPSFFVNDAKGFYHCFASGEHGNIFTFLMATEGLSFPEAVERLAQEAGLPLPPRHASPAAQARHAEIEDERGRLLAVVAAANAFFMRQLAGTVGTDARAYLVRRGLARDMIATFEIGYAPADRFALKQHLASLGFTVAEMVRSGMLIGGDDIPVPYDRFRHRVMFPIHDLKGRVIAFGGRALDPDAPAKYLNSPETPLFQKGSVLFNAHRARPLAHTAGRVVVCEGYMDVVALTEAGIGEAVAPLGTALTEQQAGLLWRLVPEPTLCLDGDAAGLKAAYRAIDTLLPHLMPGRSATFAFLPDKLDPDDLVRQRGAAAMADLLTRARPLVDVLFERETARADLSTPERRAQVEARLKAAVATIADAAVRGHYERAIRDRWYTLLRGDRGRRPTTGGTAHGGRALVHGRAAEAGRGGAGRGSPGPGSAGRPPPWAAPTGASASLKDSNLGAGTVHMPQREGLLLRALLVHPWLIEERAEDIAALTVTSEPLERLRDAILSLLGDEISLDSENIRSHLSQRGLANTVVAIERLATHRRDRFAEVSSDRETVAAQWLHAHRLHEQMVGLHRELEAARRAWHEHQSDAACEAILELHQRIVAVPSDGAP
jgi:DNA primase